MSFAIPIVVAAIAISISVYISDQLSIISENSLRNTGLLRFQPDKFQGSHQTHQYFEGWYYKFVSPLDGNASNNNSSTMSMAVVPGIFYGSTPDSNESHAFIFVTLNGERQHYYRFDIDEFSYASSKKNDEYFIQVGDHRCTHSGVSLNLYPRQGGGGDRITTDDADLVLQGNLTFSHISPWPVTLFRLGAMGPVGWLPGLECSK